MRKLERFWLRLLCKAVRKDVMSSFLLTIKDGPVKGMKFDIWFGPAYILGEYERDGIEHFISKMNSDDVVYDLGANVGYFSMAISQHTKGTIYAFEPMPNNLTKFKKHIAANKIHNVEIFDLAVSATEEEIEFADFGNSVGNTYIQDSPQFIDNKGVIRVQSDYLDNLLYEKKVLAPPQLIKIDVEGAELDVLKGARRLIEEYRPIILIATHDCHVPGIKKKCLDLLEEMNYRSELLDYDVQGEERGLEDFMAYPKDS